MTNNIKSVFESGSVRCGIHVPDSPLTVSSSIFTNADVVTVCRQPSNQAFFTNSDLSCMEPKPSILQSMS
jgi:hypothetical protein